MLILDEQLLGRGLEDALGRWYPGRVSFIMEVRPHTVIKDDAIPVLLRTQAQPTFLTINETDFWHRTALDASFCMVCFPISDAHVPVIDGRFRAVLRLPRFRTKAQRMGCMLRVTAHDVDFYTWSNRIVQTLPLPTL